MTSLAKIVELGKELGYAGTVLEEFVKEQQAIERDERANDRERAKEEQERLKLEKEKIELELKLENAKRTKPEDSSNGNQDGTQCNAWGSWATKLIPPFDENDVGMFFRAFEKVANQLEWNRESWPVLVQSVFKGRAQLAYASPSGEESQDYERVKAAILTAYYQLVSEVYTIG